MRLFSLILISLITLGGLAAAETYSGKYVWPDKKPEEYGGKTIKMTLSEAEKGVKADFVADFFFSGSKKKKAKAYHYTGILTGDPAKELSGKVYEKDSKRYWTLTMKMENGKATGSAQEPDNSKWKSKGTFVVSKDK